MRKYQVKYKVWYKTPPQSPVVKKFTLEADTDQEAENTARFLVGVNIEPTQEAQLVTLTNLSK
ncbi:MAG: hypothetical protein WCX73_05740 [Candidatus Pacearchaeota archaeon]|jgi:hypothetical protein